MVKTLVFDLDGTLLNDQHEVGKSTKEAIELALSKGVNVILASGRSPKRMGYIAKDLNLEYIVSFNGASVINIKENKEIWNSFLRENDAKEIIDFGLKNGKLMMIYKDGDLYVSKKNYITKKIGESSGMVPILFSFEDYKGISKIIYVNYFKYKTKKFMPKVIERFKDDYEITSSYSKSIEINAKDISKGNALAKLEKIINIDPKSTAVFGDGGNDVTMFMWAKYGYAMKGSGPELTKIATEVIGDNNSNTISEKITEILEIK